MIFVINNEDKKCKQDSNVCRILRAKLGVYSVQKIKNKNKCIVVFVWEQALGIYTLNKWICCIYSNIDNLFKGF